MYIDTHALKLLKKTNISPSDAMKNPSIQPILIEGWSNTNACVEINPDRTAKRPSREAEMIKTSKLNLETR